MKEHMIDYTPWLYKYHFNSFEITLNSKHETENLKLKTEDTETGKKQNTERWKPS